MQRHIAQRGILEDDVGRLLLASCDTATQTLELHIKGFIADSAGVPDSGGSHLLTIFLAITGIVVVRRDGDCVWLLDELGAGRS